ncbi:MULTISPECIES: hypothetical protein [Natrinema]|uniref:Uncharacterized protein n=1 Tax=Natrinema gari JCM 14663 TaxID=1230459 RepID=L9ZF32_9EURY|nr:MULTISPECIES: hypothetical protein [Natrinema]AFO56083.1 hypothetical protein NJ7G_0834 [Natrinema sp. J7-2]ELY83808.1 hypothetical protein C486_01224 [Natrinema gari JCM 14663]
MADDNDSERPLHSEPDEEAIDEPTTSSAQEADETAWMLKEGVSIGLIAIGAMVVLGLGLLQGTGLVDLFAPIADTGFGQWAAFAVVVLVGLTVFVWSRLGV